MLKIRNFRNLLLCASLIFLSGFTSCEPQLHHLIPAGETDTTAGMVLIPAGEATIGLSEAQFDRHKQQYPPSIPVTLEWYTVQRKPNLPAQALPEQTVYTDAFYMDIHEVTWNAYIAFTEASGYESERVNKTLSIFPDLTSKSGYFGNTPITQLTIADMKAYADFYGKQIPTEIEWEKAARGGLEDASYPWGNTIEPVHANYNHAGILNAFDANNRAVLSTVEVGQYLPNGYGLHDIAGNVSEYVVTEWDDTPHGVDKVITRGGNYRRPGYEQQIWYRNYHTTGIGFGSVGFRCVKRF